MLRSAIKKFLRKRGMVISQPPGQFNIFDIKIQSAKERGLDLKCIVDGGAHIGDWTRAIKQVYPQATVLAVEPRSDVQAQLKKTAAELGNVHVAQALLGPAESVVEFHELGAQSSAMLNSRGAAFGKTVTMPMSTIDGLVKQHRLPSPDLIKLDLQGFELEALKGATESLAAAQAVLLELSFFHFQKDAPLAGDLISFMMGRGYRIYDILALWHRPLDGALAQGDFLFLKEGHALLREESWGAGLESS